MAAAAMSTRWRRLPVCGDLGDIALRSSARGLYMERLGADVDVTEGI
jgi:hypothetical protein